MARERGARGLAQQCIPSRPCQGRCPRCTHTLLQEWCKGGSVGGKGGWATAVLFGASDDEILQYNVPRVQGTMMS